MQRIRESLAEWIAPHVEGSAASDLVALMETPKDLSFGDVALPVFRVQVGDAKKPADKASALVDRLRGSDLPALVESVDSVSGYVNITLAAAGMAEALLPEFDTYAAGNFRLPDGDGQTVTIDYSSPNVAKEFSLGHLRSTMLGHALVQLYGAAGWRTVGINHLGDWGHQFGVVILAFSREGDEQKLLRDPIRHLQTLYTKYSQYEKAEAKRGKRERANATITSADADERKKAATALGELGAESAETLTKALLAESDDGVRSAIVRALGEVGHAAAPAVEPLAKVIANPDTPPALVSPTIKSLASIGAPAVASVPALENLAARTADDKTKKAAAKAAKEIAKKAEKIAKRPTQPTRALRPEALEIDPYIENPLLPSDPESVTAQARAIDSKLQAGDPELREQWSRFRQLSLDALERTYETLGVRFDHYTGESFFEDKMDPIVETARSSGQLVESQGAQVIEMGEGRVPAMVLKSDGGTTYLLRDMAAAVYRKSEFNFDRNVYVVDTRQSDHFRQLFDSLDKIGHDWASQCQHVAFGAVRVDGSVMSTRMGNVILMEDFIALNADRVEAIMREKNPTLAEDLGPQAFAATARDVALGAILFEMAKIDRNADVDYRSEEALRFEGDTGPRVQMVYAKTGSVIRKFADTFGRDHDAATYDTAHYTIAAERHLLRLLGEMPSAVRRALEDHQPYIVARHALDIADALNSYWTSGTTFLDTENPAAAQSRVSLIARVRAAIRTLLALLGIATPERM